MPTFSKTLFELQEELKPYCVHLERAPEWFLCYPEEIDFKFVLLFGTCNVREIARCKTLASARKAAIAYLGFNDAKKTTDYNMIHQLSLLREDS
ncbi:MAG: hypothetical protein WBA57_21345 [Elainellaceae cyanobacterium]